MSAPLKPARWRKPVIIKSKSFTANMSSPTSTPKPTAPVIQKKLKLRASCDSCAASKVKCSKDHPICARCFANNTQCIYGISRKHGKPGRSRTKNPDGTPFIKVSKQRLSPERTDFSNYTTQPERSLLQTDLEMGPNWASDWSTTTPSLPATPDFDVEATAPFYTSLDSSELGFMDASFLSTPQVKPKTAQIAQPDFVFREQFAEAPLEQLCSPEPQSRDICMDAKAVKPLEYTYNDTMSTAHPHSFSSSSSTIHTPMSQSMGPYDTSNFLASSSKSTPHCCYTLAYSTLQSFGMLSTDKYPVIDQETLTAGLSTARLAVNSILQLIHCPCSSDPHLAMLYSSMTSKILTWYRMAGGVEGTASLNSSVTASSQQIESVYHVPFSQPEFSSSLIGAGNNEGMSYTMQDMHVQTYKLDELERQRHRSQIVLYELRNCEKVVEALVGWRGNRRSCEQAKYLYDVLGAWLEGELHKTKEEIRAVEIPHMRVG